MSAPQKQNRGLAAALVLIIVLLALAFGLKRCRFDKPAITRTTAIPTKETRSNNDNTVGLNRRPAKINYSKHARCRMSCRHISEAEVKDILVGGNINYKKSDLDGDACHKRYAVEGSTKDGQRVRIIFAPCNDVETVVTVIDLGSEWTCDCK